MHRDPLSNLSVYPRWIELIVDDMLLPVDGTRFVFKIIRGSIRDETKNFFPREIWTLWASNKINYSIVSRIISLFKFIDIKTDRYRLSSRRNKIKKIILNVLFKNRKVNAIEFIDSIILFIQIFNPIQCHSLKQIIILRSPKMSTYTHFASRCAFVHSKVDYTDLRVPY